MEFVWINMVGSILGYMKPQPNTTFLQSYKTILASIYSALEFKQSNWMKIATVLEAAYHNAWSTRVE